MNKSNTLVGGVSANDADAAGVLVLRKHLMELKLEGKEVSPLH